MITDSNQNITVVHVMGYDSKKFGGLERYILELASTARSKGIKIIVGYNSRPKSEEYLQLLRQNNIEIFVANAMSPLNFTKVIRGIIKKHKPIVIHSHFQPLWPGILGLIFGVSHRWNTVRMMLVDKEIREVTSREELKKTNRLYRMLINYFNNRFFSVSCAVYNQYTKVYPVQASKFEVLHNGGKPNPTERKIARHQQNFEEGTVYICCVAFASRMKGVDILIDAAYALSKLGNLPKFKICLIGLAKDAPYTNEILIKIKDYQIGGWILHYNIINNVPQILPAMDIFVQPSRSESLSNSIIEAGFAGVPAIGSNVGGIPEVIVNNSTGYLFEKANVAELVTKLRLLIENESLRKQMGRNAKQHMLDNFLMTDKVAKMVGYYEAVATKRKHS